MHARDPTLVDTSGISAISAWTQFERLETHYSSPPIKGCDALAAASAAVASDPTLVEVAAAGVWGKVLRRPRTCLWPTPFVSLGLRRNAVRANGRALVQSDQQDWRFEEVR